MEEGLVLGTDWWEVLVVRYLPAAAVFSYQETGRGGGGASTALKLWFF